MKRWYQITGVVLFLVAVFLIRASIGLRYYTPLGPGPGFFPLWLSILLAILAVAMFCQATFGKPEAMPADFYADWKGYLRIGGVVAALVGSIVLMESLGFCLVMLVFYLFVLTVLGRQHPLVTGIIAFAGSFGMYYVFVHWLATPLPIGLFGF
ncbi:MAG: tripartite tricarboxylate transporter TctB family protein [Syntrophales bacterium]|nr:tripartite tricarboxylate transporter TctB family protein [Syntrophales bacterium]